MIKIIPRPFRDIILGCSIIENYNQLVSIAPKNLCDQSKKEFLQSETGRFIQEKKEPVLLLAKEVITAVSRVALAALGGIAVYSLAGPMDIKVVAIVGSMLSVPATVIAGGGFLTYMGVSMLTSAVAKSSLVLLECGVAALAGGWLTLGLHDVESFGLAEVVISKASSALAPSLVRAYI